MQTIESDRALPPVQGFASCPIDKEGGYLPLASKAVKQAGTITFQQLGWISGAWRPVTVTAMGANYHIDVAGIGAFDLLDQGRMIRYGEPASGHEPLRWVGTVRSAVL